MQYPDAPRLPVVDELHGHRVADPYRWLEDATSTETEAWSAAQDALVRPFLDGQPGRDELGATLHRLLGAGGVGAPVHRGDRAFFTRRTGGQQHAVLMTRTGDDAATDRPLLDPAALDPTGLTTLDAWSPSRDGRLLAYQLSSGGDEESVLHVLDVSTGDPVGQPLDRTRYSSVAWLPDGSGFYYVRRESLDSPFDRRVLLHRLADDRSAAGHDTYVFGEGRDPRTYYGVSLSRDGRWLVVTASVGTEPRDDVWIADLAAGPAHERLTVVQEGVDARCSAGVAFDGRLYVWTDRDAPRGRLCVADPAEPTVWTDLVGEDPGAVLADFTLTDDAVVVCRSRHALSELEVLDRTTGAARATIDLPGPGTVTALVGRPEGGTQVWIGWTDWTTPPGVLVCDVTTAGTGAEPPRARTWEAAPGGAPDLAVSARQEVYRSADGTEVRLHVLAPGDPTGAGEPGRPRPTVLYGYGGFGIPMDPGYTTSALAWVAAGGVWAVANLRGGTEEGEDWHRAGMREHKQNVFDDLHAAAEHLRTTGRTSTLGIYGGSNGGLLVGAALTQRPDLYDAVVCSAPLLDMVRYELFGLGRTWNDEYGTAEDPTELGWLLGYSPVHAVRAGPTYPATLFEVFESDTRVDPLHARKMCAALQAVQPSDGPPILIRRETDVGHSARSVDRTVALSVDTLSFLAGRLGLDLTVLAGAGEDA